jgi:dCMP deaminase
MVEFNEYYMIVALAVRERANCKGRKVGAIVVKDNRIIGAGYNGTPESMANCENGGCVRCEKYRNKSQNYDKCICVHAEQNAMITAARFGHSVQHSIIYTTLQPCFTCTKEFLQAKIKTVYYLDELDKKNPTEDNNKSTEDKDFDVQYKILFSHFEKYPIKIEKNSLIPHIDNIKKYLQE